MNFYDALKKNIRDSLCSFLSDVAAYKRTMERIGPFDTPLILLPNAPALAYGLFCNTAPEPPPLPPQLEGGQCETNYRARAQGSYTVKNPNDGSLSTTLINPYPNFLRSGPGPLKLIFTGLVRHNIDGGPVWDANPFQVKLSLQFSGESIYDFYWGPCVSGYVKLIAERSDGLPDNCGNPPIFIPPFPVGGNIIVSPTIFTNNNNVSISVPTTFEFGVGDISIKGELNIPVKISIGSINFEASVKLSTGDISFGNIYDNSQDTYYSPTGDDCLPSGRPTSPLPNRPPNSPVPPGNPIKKEQRAVLVGVVCKLNGVGRRDSLIIPPDNKCPKVIAPYGGLLWFSYRIGDKSIFGEDIKLKHDYQYVPCPFPGQAIGYRACGRDASITVDTVAVYGRPNLFKDTE